MLDQLNTCMHVDSIDTCGEQSSIHGEFSSDQLYGEQMRKTGGLWKSKTFKILNIQDGMTSKYFDTYAAVQVKFTARAMKRRIGFTTMQQRLQPMYNVSTETQ